MLMPPRRPGSSINGTCRNGSHIAIPHVKDPPASPMPSPMLPASTALTYSNNHDSSTSRISYNIYHYPLWRPHLH